MSKMSPIVKSRRHVPVRNSNFFQCNEKRKNPSIILKIFVCVTLVKMQLIFRDNCFLSLTQNCVDEGVPLYPQVCYLRFQLSVGKICYPWICPMDIRGFCTCLLLLAILVFKWLCLNATPANNEACLYSTLHARCQLAISARRIYFSTKIARPACFASLLKEGKTRPISKNHRRVTLAISEEKNPKTVLDRENINCYHCTVKLGYNELGYNELSYNELGYNEQTWHTWLVWVILRIHFLWYNEQNPVITNKIWPKCLWKADF